MTDKIYVSVDNQRFEATGEILDQLKKDWAEAKAAKEAADAAELAKEATKQSALAKLAKIGLTEEEAKAVIGLA